MRDTAGWEIGGEFYPLTFTFKWGDPALVHEVTGLAWDEFEEPIIAVAGANGDGTLSALTLSGLLAVAVKRVHPEWSRAKVRKYVENLDVSAAELVAPDEPEEDDTGPPAVTAGETSSTSADKSESGSGSTSNESTPEPSGTPTSPTSPEGPSD